MSLMQIDPFIRKSVVGPLHGLFLTLMADLSFKGNFSVAYAQVERESDCVCVCVCV